MRSPRFIFALAVLAWPSTALAYRPFDSTDAAVADLGNIELEFSPLSYRHDDLGRTWIAPAARFNYGFAKTWEVVLEGQAEHPQRGPSVLVDNALSLKTVLREGSLQDKDGLSLATEAGVLLPGVNDEKGVGASWAAIAGQRWGWGAVNLNATAALTRDQHGEILLGAIIEGPDKWKVRPVGELIYNHTFGGQNEFATLAGVIWKVGDKLSFDLAVRQGSIGSRPETEIRTGLTVAFGTR
jgi:hypothetical protein